MLKSYVTLGHYITVATDIWENSVGRSPHLVAEWCLDIYPESNYEIRQYVRQLVLETIEHLEGSA